MKTFLEAVIDIPRRTYAKGVFDDADTNNPKLKSVVIGMIMKQLKDFEERFAPIVKYSLIGSILTKRYRNDADLDINVLFDVPPGDRETMRKTIAKSLKDVNGKLVPGTEHPINYYVITDPKVGQWETAYGWGDHSTVGYITGNETITLSGAVTGSGTTSITTTLSTIDGGTY